VLARLNLEQKAKTFLRYDIFFRPVLFLLIFTSAVSGFAPDLFCGESGSFNKKDFLARYGGAAPVLWGENLPGIRTKLDTKENVIALTFDACGSKTDGYDADLIVFLKREKIPATLFMSGRWIDKFPKEFQRLSEEPLFEIENHGLNHKPCSVKGKSVYGIKGTSGVEEVFDEVELNAQKIEKFTGKRPRYFRSGTANYDDIAVKIIYDLGFEPVGFNINGDYGATATKDEIKKSLLGAPPGSIVIFHMNRPGRGTLEGLKEALPAIREKRIRFVMLSDYKLK